MAASKSNFDWSSLDRNGLATFFWFLAPKIVNQPITVDKFHRLITRHIKQYIPLKVSKNIDLKANPNVILIGGCYYSHHDEDHKTSIELMMFYNPQDEFLKINKSKFWRICYGFADTILHEVIHMRQFRRREFKHLPDYASTASKTEKRKEQAYLGCSDEIDAYAFNIACELTDKFKNNQRQIIKYLNFDQRGVRTKYDTWRIYLKAFDHNHDHEIIKRLKKKIIRYIPLAEIGKPYRNRDWICY